jgi:hypothetical protein
MMLIRLSGHSGAGKTRLINALPEYGIHCPKVLRYTSRPARINEVHGQDYFMSRAFIEALPEKDFLVGPVRNMVQAFDLKQLEIDLGRHDLVLIEIYPALWPKLLSSLAERMEKQPTSASVFMTAVDPVYLKSLGDEQEKTDYITHEVEKILVFRNKDEAKDIQIRASSAAGEILEALSPEGEEMYAKILHSAPEGTDGEDEWTKQAQPVGQAKVALDEFIELYSKLAGISFSEEHA